jgi:hypothetical protein
VKDPFAFLYSQRCVIESLGTYYRPPKVFEHGKRALVATVEAEGDGQTVKVYETRLPAHCFTIEVQAGRNSVGAMQPGYRFSTGTGQDELAGALAVSIARGMLGLDFPRKPAPKVIRRKRKGGNKCSL